MRKTASVFGMLAGIVCIIFSIITFVYASNCLPTDEQLHKPKREDYTYSSAYEEKMEEYELKLRTYKAAYATPFGIGALLMFGGIGMICLFATKFDEKPDIDKEKSNSVYVPRTNVKPLFEDAPKKVKKDWYCPMCGTLNSRLVTVCSYCDYCTDRQKQ